MSGAEPEGLREAVDVAAAQLLARANDLKRVMDSHSVPPAMVATVLVSALANTIGSVLHSLVQPDNRTEVVRQISAKLHVQAMIPAELMAETQKTETGPARNSGPEREDI